MNCNITDSLENLNNNDEKLEISDILECLILKSGNAYFKIFTVYHNNIMIKCYYNNL